MKDTSMVHNPPLFPLKQWTARMLDAFKEYIPLPDATAARWTRDNMGGIVSIWSLLHWEHNISLLHCLPSFYYTAQRKRPGWKQRELAQFVKSEKDREREKCGGRDRERQWDKGGDGGKSGKAREKEPKTRRKRKTENELSAGGCLDSFNWFDFCVWLHYTRMASTGCSATTGLKVTPASCSQNTHFSLHSITN